MESAAPRSQAAPAIPRPTDGGARACARRRGPGRGWTAWVALLALGTAPAAAAPAPGPPKPEAVATVAGGKGSQASPAATQLAKGTVLLAFERLFTAHRRRVYVQRRRPGRGWSWARALPLIKGDFTQRDPSLVARQGGEVLLYVQVGDLRRRRAAVRLYRSQGDSLRWRDAGRLPLGLGPRSALTQPFAAPDAAGGVLLTVTRRFAGAADGCHFARAADGRRFGTLRRVGLGTRCRVVSTGPRQLVLTYQSRQARRLPWRSFFRRSADGGRTWSAPTAVSALGATAEAHPLVLPGGSLRFFFVARGRRGSAIQSATWTGTRRVERRLTRPRTGRDLDPFGLHTSTGTWLYFTREVRPLDFDVLGRQLK